MSCEHISCFKIFVSWPEQIWQMFKKNYLSGRCYLPRSKLPTFTVIDRYLLVKFCVYAALQEFNLLSFLKCHWIKWIRYVRRGVVYILLWAERVEKGGGDWGERMKDRKGEYEEKRRSKENIPVPYRIQSKKPVLWIRMRLDRHYFARSGSVPIHLNQI